MAVERRQEVVRSQGICINCLYPGHHANQCKSSFTCRHCSQKHHTMLHKDSTPAVTAASTSTTNVMVTSTGNVGVPTILSTAKVAVTNGRLTQVTRALLDDGSVTSFISEQLANTLRLNRTPCQRSFTGATCHLLECRSQVTVNLNIPGPAVTEPIAVVCYMVQQLPETVPPEYPAAVLSHPFLKDKYSFSDKELGGKVDLLLGIADASRCHLGPCVYSDDKRGMSGRETIRLT